MNKTLCINRLYAWVLHNDMEKHNITIQNVIKGIEHMKGAYKHKTLSLTSDYAEVADFQSPAYRCAYLHKYAPIHTILVSDIVERVIDLHYNYFYDIIINSGCVNVCSLGGGPGSDIVGIVLSLHNAFGPFQVYTSVIDCMPHWNNTLNSLIRETQRGSYGKLKTCFSAQYFDWNYIGANLLEEFSEKVIKAISSADIINMVKFVSAAVCVDTPLMIKRIFSVMKPGAIVFFVDNSVGNIKYIFSKMAEECELEPLYGPVSHEHYINKLVETMRFGYSSCFQTKIAIQVWVKPHRPVQTWCGSPVQVWTPFEKIKRESANQVQSTPMFNGPNCLQEPFSDVSKSLRFDDTELDSFDDCPDIESSFCSDEIQLAVKSKVVIPGRPINSPSFSGNFRKRSLLSSPNFSDSLLSSPSVFNPFPLLYNINNAYASPIPFRNKLLPNFEVKRTVENSLSTSRLDSGCWSALSSFNEMDDSNTKNDVDYRTLVTFPANEPNHSYSNTNNWNSQNFNSLNHLNECQRYEQKNWYENQENMRPSSNQWRDNEMHNWRNERNDFRPKAPTRNRNRKFNPYKNRMYRI